MRAFLLILLSLAPYIQSKHHRRRAPIIDIRGAERMVGTIREDETVLNTVPDLGIVVESGPICDYILTSTDGSLVPFKAELLDRYTGAAIIRLKESTSLDCKKASYSLQVKAVKCEDDGARSEPVPLIVTVKDTNNHEPEFEHAWYTATIDEGTMHSEIIKVTAMDADCGQPFGEICEYEITNGIDKFPFTINAQGVIRNTRPLNASAAHSYILTVVAHDCGMRKSKSALVTVNVRAACVEGISGVPERLPYSPRSGEMKLMPKVALSICEDNKEKNCTVSRVSALVELHATHVSNGCSKDTIYSNETIKRCNLNSKTIALLDEETDFEGSSSEEGERFLFDGSSNAYIVPYTSVDEIVPDKFTVSFSMKHAEGTKREQNTKQNILCESDENEMNRHHFSVYVRHCKLEVVLRREAGATAEFRAAEWRWNISEVCDNEWHSYSIIFNGVDDVNLLIDGREFKHDERNPEILDDWPLHKTKTLKTRLVIGACWHGRSLSLAQFFKGSLSSVYLLEGESESVAAIACSHLCPERLDLDGKAGDKRIGSTALALEAANTEQLAAQLRKMTYTNSQEQPTPGHRSVKMTVTAQCKEVEHTISLPEYKGYVFVQHERDPVLSISGTVLVSADQQELKIGTTMLPDLRITVLQSDDEGNTKDVTEKQYLDYCKIHLKPSRDMDVEYFSSPATLIASTKIDFEHDKQGILLRGEDTVGAYLEVLSKIHFFNTRPDTYSKRIYAVQCAMLKGRVLSNEFVVTMSIEPSSSAESYVNAAVPVADGTAADELARHFEPAFDQLGGSRLQNILEMDLPRPKALLSHHGYDIGKGAVAGGAVAVVVVVCVGFLLVLLVVGVLKMRDAPAPRRHRRPKKNAESGMEWDDSGMNITVNPLDDVEKIGAGSNAQFSDEDSSDGEESECSYHDEEEMSEEEDDEDDEIMPHVVSNGAAPLEWDDEAESTAPLAPVTTRNPRGEAATGAIASSAITSTRPASARSYRV